MESKPSCLDGRRQLTFSDTFTTTLEDYDGDLSGDFVPLERLSVYNNLPAGGDWTLRVYDSDVDGLVGTLHSWDIEFTMEKCTPEYTWEQITVSTGTPPVRFEHSSLAVDTSMFVYGGRNEKPLHDLYRLDYTGTSTGSAWTTLAPLPRTTSRTGALWLLTPYQLLRTGGLIQSSRRTLTEATPKVDAHIYRRELVHEKELWTLVNTTGNAREVQLPSLHRDQLTSSPSLEQLIPMGRYSTAAVFVSGYDAACRLRGIVESTIILFGG